MGRTLRLTSIIASIWLGVSTTATAGTAKNLPKSFTLRGLKGGLVTRSDLEGKTVILQFFASWCKGCGEVMGQMGPVAVRHSEVRFLPVSVDESIAEAKGYFKIQRDSVKPIESLAAFDQDAKLASALGVQALPAVIVVDGMGKVLLSLTGHPNSEQMKELESFLPH